MATSPEKNTFKNGAGVYKSVCTACGECKNNKKNPFGNPIVMVC